MKNLEDRIEKLEKQTGKESGGHEFLIEYPNGEVVRFRRGDGPPWHTTTFKVMYEQGEDKRKEFEKNMHALLNGKRTEQ